MPSTTHTRQDYLAHRCTHREYYAQLVNESTRLSVRARIGVERLLASTDEHYFNDIPLREWDSLCGFHQSGSRITGSPRLPTTSQWSELNDGPSLGSLVCVAKEAARQLVDEARAIGPWS